MSSNTTVIQKIGTAVSTVAPLAGPYGILIDLAFTLGQALVGALTKAKAPIEVIAASQAAVDAILAHKSDLLTKANFEAQRG